MTLKMFLLTEHWERLGYDPCLGLFDSSWESQKKKITVEKVLRKRAGLDRKKTGGVASATDSDDSDSETDSDDSEDGVEEIFDETKFSSIARCQNHFFYSARILLRISKIGMR